jgi:uncharacterized membrane protein YphA (DoxX/SURF4 family)
MLGLSLFVYADGTASMVPIWLPDRLGFAYLTGAGHVASGAGILLGIVPRLAAAMEAISVPKWKLSDPPVKTQCRK